MDELLCPVCGHKLEEDDCYDTETGFDMYWEYWCGHCPNCERNFEWTKTYAFVRYEELIEVQ